MSFSGASPDFGQRAARNSAGKHKVMNCQPEVSGPTTAGPCHVSQLQLALSSSSCSSTGSDFDDAANSRRRDTLICGTPVPPVAPPVTHSFFTLTSRF